MNFGMRFDLRNPGFAGVEMADRYEAALDMAEWGDARGADLITLSEHHGSDDGYLPSALAMAAAFAARTTHARIDVRAVVAAFHDPLRLAEDAAVVDLLSRGRLTLTVAGGYVAEEFQMFGVGVEERPQRVAETVAALRSAWTGQPFEFRGRPARVTPRPAQPSGPPVVLGGSSEGAARRAARIADGFLPAEPRFYEYYRDECVKLGRPDPGAYRGPDTSVVVLAEDPEAAWPVLAPYFLHEVNAYGRWAAGAVSVGYQPVESVEQLRSFGQYRILTPSQFRDETEERGEDAYVLLHPMAGGIPPALAWEHLRLFERCVLDSGGGR